jgi:hypothetical protein
MASDRRKARPNVSEVDWPIFAVLGLLQAGALKVFQPRAPVGDVPLMCNIGPQSDAEVTHEFGAVSHSSKLS